MGIFSRRGSKGFDPDLWTDSKQRAHAADSAEWTSADHGVEDLDAIATNAGARFSDDDQAWLADDPGEAVRNRRRNV